MRILMRLLESVLGYNSFCEVDELDYSQGSGDSIYFRLIQDKSGGCEECNKLRWIPSPTATMSFTFNNIDSNAVITRTGVMAFPNEDRSVWRVDMMPGDKITGVVSATLTDGGKTITVPLDGRLNVISTGDDNFFC